jgi:hypothetical protein
LVCRSVLLAGEVMLNAVWVESKLDVTLAVIGMSTTAAGVVDALESGVAETDGTGGVLEAVAVAVVGGHERTQCALIVVVYRCLDHTSTNCTVSHTPANV